MLEKDTYPTYGYACIWTYPDERHAMMFASILNDILTKGRTHLKPYSKRSNEIDAIDLTDDELNTLHSEAESKIGQPNGLLWLTLDKLRNDGCLNLGLFAEDSNAVIGITNNNQGISTVRFRASVYQNPEGQFIPFEHPFGNLTSIVRFK